MLDVPSLVHMRAAEGVARVDGELAESGPQNIDVSYDAHRAHLAKISDNAFTVSTVELNSF
jgi:hypothetical protein